ATVAHSGSDLKPLPVLALKWTYRSFVRSSGVMNPYRFASLNHLTVPVAMQKHLPRCFHERVRKAWSTTRLALKLRPHCSRSQEISSPSEQDAGVVAAQAHRVREGHV